MGQLGIRIPNVNTKQRTLVAPKKRSSIAIQNLSVSVCDSPKCSARKCAQSLGMERYVAILEEFKDDVERRFPRHIKKLWLQQDGASSHTSRLALDWLQTNFGNRVVSLKTNFEWAPHSPDLPPPDCFLWGYLKDRVYKDKPQTIAEL